MIRSSRPRRAQAPQVPVPASRADVPCYTQAYPELLPAFG